MAGTQKRYVIKDFAVTTKQLHIFNKIGLFIKQKKIVYYMLSHKQISLIIFYKMAGKIVVVWLQV